MTLIRNLIVVFLSTTTVAFADEADDKAEFTRLYAEFNELYANSEDLDPIIDVAEKLLSVSAFP